MSNFTKKIMKKPRKFTRFVGLTVEQFRQLSDCMLRMWEEVETNRLSRKNRRRRIGGGMKYRLKSMDEKLLLVLLYYRHYFTQEVLSYLFGIDQSSVSRLITKLTPLIEQAADGELKTFLDKAKVERDKKLVGWNIFVEKYPELLHAITDATENRTFRPKDNEEQKKHYSGKKKAHTLKTQITVSRSSKIIDVSNTYPGSVHDKKVADKEKTIEKIPDETTQYLDLGYQGMNKDHPEKCIVLPPKKQKGKKLTPHEKEIRKTQSRYRVIVEHVISRIKKYKICSDVYRGPRKKFNQIFRNVAAIHNLKLELASNVV